MFFIENHNFIVKIIGNEIQVWINIFHDIDIYGNDGDVDIFTKHLWPIFVYAMSLCKSNCFKVGVDVNGIAYDMRWRIIF